MLSISFSIVVLHSVCQIPVHEAPKIPVNETRFWSVYPGFEKDDALFDIDDLSSDALDHSFELGCTSSFVAFVTVWLLAYRKLQKELQEPTFSESLEGAEISPDSPTFSQMCPPPKSPPKSPPEFLPKAVPKCPPRGKGPGKAPPKAPPRKAAAAAKGDAEAKIFGARRVRWRALQSASGTIFDGLQTGQLRTETAKMLNEVFRVTQGQTARSSSFITKSSGVCLLDQNRAMQLAIIFKGSRVPVNKLCSALESLDFSISLGDEEIDGLLQAWPTPADFKLVDEYKGPKEELRDVEQCIKQMSKVSRSEARLKLLRLSSFLAQCLRSEIVGFLHC